MTRLSLLLLSIISSSLAFSAEPGARERSVGADRFAAGPAVSVSAPVAGDLFLAGCSLDLDAPVGGDAVAAGCNVRLGGQVGQDLYAAGGRVSLNAAVLHNARIAGGSIEIGSRAKIAGNASVAGGEIRIAGPVGGYLQVGGGHVFLDAPVAGDVQVAAGTVELGPGARIGGRLRYASSEELKRDPAAQVQGGIERLPLPAHAPKATPAERERAARGIHWIWSAGLITLAAILAAALPALFTGTATIVRTRWAWSLLVGFIALVCIPVAALIALVTVIGIPLALAAMALYFALLLIGYATTGISLGLLALQRWQPARTSGGWRFLAAALGMLAVALVASIPYVGALIVLAALLLGIGVLLQRLFLPAAAAPDRKE